MVDWRVSAVTRVRLAENSIRLADVISFGMAPALLVYQIVLGEFQNLGWMIAFVYLACGALRLARFQLRRGEWRLERARTRILPVSHSRRRRA